MLTKTITYTDYNGVEREEKHYFNLSKAEIVKMNMSVSGGLIEIINRVIEEQNVPELYNIFEDLIHKSYGIKSPDGKRFEKSEDIYLAFAQTEAYSVLIEELITDAKAAAKFFNAIVPQNSSKPALASAEN